MQDPGLSLGIPIKERLCEKGAGPLCIQGGLYFCLGLLEEDDCLSSLKNTKVFPMIREQRLWGDRSVLAWIMDI